MRFARFTDHGRLGLAVANADNKFRGLTSADAGYPGDLDELIAQGEGALRKAGHALSAARLLDLTAVTLLPPLRNPGKIICIGLNYVDHSNETGFQQPDYPMVFSRFVSTLIGHGATIERPRISEQLDYEGEFVVVIGRGGKHITKEDALKHVIGYSLFNDVSVRDYQRRTAQWTVGKNFDASGPFGPYLATADEFPPGCKGLRLQTRLNGAVVQDANTNDLVFDVVTLIATLSDAFTLEPGDIIVTGTSAGVGGARKPPLWMKNGDVVEIELEGFGVLRNVVGDEPAGQS
jgi:2-keto-4-pentenoate hydratase/2-oxohepta-3-ene-1,7-dioic acid hydratase in catechol pathway